MTGLNKKGPQNMGPMTGRKLGTCSIDTVEKQDKQTFGQREGGYGRRTGGAGRFSSPALGRGVNPGRGRRMRGQLR